MRIWSLWGEAIKLRENNGIMKKSTGIIKVTEKGELLLNIKKLGPLLLYRTMVQSQGKFILVTNFGLIRCFEIGWLSFPLAIIKVYYLNNLENNFKAINANDVFTLH